MKRKRLARQLTLGALVTGLVPLSAAAGAGAGPAGAPGASLCRTTFGEQGPSGGRVVGEGPSGDPMPVTIGWDANDWANGLSQIVTCVSVDGHGVPSLTTVTNSPPNTGTLTLGLTLPAGDPGVLACQQSILVGTGATEGRTRPTSPVCFKLRASDPPPPTRVGGHTADGAAVAGPKTPPGPPVPAPSAQPARPAAPAHPAPPTELARSTPPARAAFEAALGETPIAGLVGVAPPKAPVASAPAPARVASAAARASVARKAPVAGSSAVPGAAVSSLPHTGFDHRVPLAGAGGLLAIGGLSILLGADGRKRSGGLV